MINILVIEDDVSIREIINYNLSNKFSVLTADNAEEGLEICQEEKIDLILLDWMLPGMSGLSFLRTIKKKGLTSSIPVIFITAKHEEEDKLAGFTFPFPASVIFRPEKALAKRVAKFEPNGVRGLLRG